MATKIKKLLTMAGALLFIATSASVLAATGTSQVDGSPSPGQTALSFSSTTVTVDKQKVANNPIVSKVLNPIVNILSALVGIVVVGTIILGGIQYSVGGDNAEALTKAKKRISNGAIALLAFLFTFAFLQWLIPGGVF